MTEQEAIELGPGGPRRTPWPSTSYPCNLVVIKAKMVDGTRSTFEVVPDSAGNWSFEAPGILRDVVVSYSSPDVRFGAPIQAARLEFVDEGAHLDGVATITQIG